MADNQQDKALNQGVVNANTQREKQINVLKLAVDKIPPRESTDEEDGDDHKIRQKKGDLGM